MRKFFICTSLLFFTAANASAGLEVYGGPTLGGQDLNFVGVGAGFIELEYEQPSATFLNGDDTITGFQAEVGMAYQLPTVTIFSAVKYQEGFDEGTIQSESVEYNSTSAVIGIRF